jgi:hypothetical protein
VYNPVTHMLPPTFPILLVVPAVLFDLLRRRHDDRGVLLAIALGAAFVLSLLVVQWPFAEFLLSPAARNAFFVADRWDYSSELGSWRYEYWDLDRDAKGAWSAWHFWIGIGVAVAIAAVKSWVGLAWGRWMREVRR